jgi:hypothetical protein
VEQVARSRRSIFYPACKNAQPTRCSGSLIAPEVMTTDLRCRVTFRLLAGANNADYHGEQLVGG